MQIPVRIAGVQADTPEDDPIVMLQELEGVRSLPIWIGESEAQILSLALADVELPRPFTHDIVIAVAEQANRSIVEVCITAERDGIFWAELQMNDGTRIDCRPSDGIILAAKTKCLLSVNADVFARFELELRDLDQEKITDEEVEEFQKLLDNLSADDFLNDDSTEDGLE